MRFTAHLRSQFLDLSQVSLHFTPAIPQSIVGAGMEHSLEGPHSVFQIHDEQLLFNHRGGVVEREQIGQNATTRGYQPKKTPKA